MKVVTTGKCGSASSARVNQLGLCVPTMCTYVNEEQNRTSNFRLNDRLRASIVHRERTKISPSLGRSPDIIQ